MKRLMLYLVLLVLITSQFLFSQFLSWDTQIIIKKTQDDIQFSSVAVSDFGYIYLLENTRHEIYRVDYDGNVLNVMGGFGWEEGQLDTPKDITLSSGLDVIVADYNNHRLVRFDRYLNYLSTYPSIELNNEIGYPLSVAVSSLGDLYVLDEENSEIIRILPGRNEEIRFGGFGSGEFALNKPTHIRTDNKNSIYALEIDCRIIRFDRFGNPLDVIQPQYEVEHKAFTAVNNHILALNEDEPYIISYSLKRAEWKTIPTNNEVSLASYVSITSNGDNIVLLKPDGVIDIYRLLQN